MLKIDIEQIRTWMVEKYDFWKTSFPYYQNKPESFWQLHPISELPKRLQHLNILAKYVECPSSLTIVDVGSAGGMEPYLLHKQGFNVNGLDWRGISSQEELEKLHPGVKVYALHFDKEIWRIKDSFVDIVTFLDTIEHVHPPQIYL